MKKIIIFLLVIFNCNIDLYSMEKKPFHHLPDGTFRNPEGSPQRDSSFNWSFKIFNQEKKKLDMNIPDDHVIKKEKVLKDIKKYENNDYVAWIGHATFLIKLGNTTIITDPVFEKNMGPLFFGPKRFVDPAISLKEIPEVNLFLLTHNHYDHLSTRTIQRFPFKKAKVLAPLKLGKYFSKNAGPFIFGPKRFTEPALKLNEIPKIDLFLLTHNHYDHQDMMTIRKFPYKNVKVMLPLKLGKYFTRNGYKDVNEMDWYDEIIINEKLKITFLPAVHWSKRSLIDTNKTLWGNFLIKYNDKKILFACDTGIGNIYKDIGNKYGPIDLTFINIGAYNFYPISPHKDKSAYHTNPEEALSIGRDLKSKKLLGMHWGTFVLSLEPIMEPPIRFKNNAEKYGFKKEDAIIFKIGEFNKLQDLIN